MSLPVTTGGRAAWLIQDGDREPEVMMVMVGQPRSTRWSTVPDAAATGIDVTVWSLD